MAQKFSDKLQDYIRYAHTARKHYDGGLYSDCALNCRKACEAFCKTLLYFRFTDKVAEEKISDNSLKELILVLIKNRLIERKIVNWLESIQIIGNKAAHDNEINKDEGTYVLKALDFITEWLFAEWMNTPIPEKLKYYRENIKESITDEKQKEVIEKIIVRETIIKENNEDILSRLKEIEAKNQDQSSYNELTAAINEARKNIEQLQSEKNIDSIQPVKKKLSKKQLVLIGGILILMFGFVIYLSSQYWKKVDAKNFNLVKSSDSLYIGIYYLNVLQENPNINFKIEDQIETQILQVVREFQLPLSVRKLELDYKNFNRDSDIVNYSQKAGFDLIYFGNLYESALKEENQVNIKCFLIDKSASRSNEIKFSSLTDSSIIKEIRDQSNMPVFLYCNEIFKTGKKTDLLPLLNSLTCYSSDNKASQDEFISEIYRKQNNYKAALEKINNILSYNPNDRAYFMASKANFLRDLKQFDSAKVYFKLSLSQDSLNFNTLVNYGDCLYQSMDSVSALSIFQKADKINPSSAIVKYSIGRINFVNRRYNQAKHLCLEAFHLDKTIKENNSLLAELYAFRENNCDSAEYFYGLVLGKDSTDAQALTRLANYYIHYYFSKKDFAKYLLNKADKKNSQIKLNTYYDEGLLAFTDKEYKTTIELLEKAYQGNYQAQLLFTFLAQSYFYTGNKPKALFYIKEGMRYDSTSFEILKVYAFLLSKIEPEKTTRVNYYFNKALKVQFADELALVYGEYLHNQKKYKEAIDLGLKIYSRNSTNIALNQLLGNAYCDAGKLQLGKPYFEKLNILAPDNDTAMYNLAQCIFVSSKTVDEDFVRGAKLIKRSVDKNPNNPYANFLAALYFYKGNNPSEAIKYYQASKKINKDISDPKLEELLKKNSF